MASENENDGDDLEDVRRSEQRLRNREIAVAISAASIFFLLIFGPGRADLLKGDGTTVSVLANAATVAAAISIPLAIFAGGADLVAWIARIVIEVLRRRGATPLQPVARFKTSKNRRFQFNKKLEGSSHIGCIVATISALIVAALVAGAISFAMHLLQSETESRRPTSSAAPSAAAREQSAALPAFCSREAGEVICSANSLAASPEALGLLVCGKAGLGWEIFRANKTEQGFTFDHRHIPQDTRLSIRCGDR